MEKAMPSFILTGMNKTGRFDPEISSPDIAGLGTSDLVTCVALVIIGEATKRISLTHHVGGLERDYSSIQEEIKWVCGGSDSPFIIRLAKNSVGMRTGLSAIKAELKITSEADFEKHDTETLIIQFLRQHQLIKNLKTRKDTVSGQILVTREGQLLTAPPKGTDLRSGDNILLRNAIEMINGIYSKVLLSPRLEFDGKKFLDHELIQPALYMLNLVTYQLTLMECGNSLENIYLALTKIDSILKSMGSKTGAKLDVYGKEPSARRDDLLNDIKQIIESGKMPVVAFAQSITDRINAASKKEAAISLKSALS